MEKTEQDVCCLCGREIIGYGNNAESLRRGKCCDLCNDALVIPYRMYLIEPTFITSNYQKILEELKNNPELLFKY